MGRAQQPLERDGSPVREFAFWLRDRRNQSGLTYVQLGQAAHYATSTVQAAASGNSLPTQRVALAFVRACGGDVGAWRAYWTQIRRLLDQDAPDAVSRVMAPPWASLDGASRSGAAGTPAGWASPPGQLGATAAEAPDGWFCESGIALLLLDADPIESLEQRVVVAAADGLSELATSMSVPRRAGDAREAHDLHTELLHGGSLELREQPFESYFRNVVVLPRSLRRGERHSYALRYRLPPQQPIAPHYVQVPHRRTDYFEARVRFHQARRPRAVWQVSGVPTAVIYESAPARDLLVPDRFGEVHVSFRDLRPGLSYGVCWQD
jgi:hypothetical protein